MKIVHHLFILLSLGLAVLAAPYQSLSPYTGVTVGREVCQYQLDTYGREHEVACVKSDRCVNLPLVPHMYGVVALITKKVLRKDTWENGGIVGSTKTKLGLCR